MFAFRVKSFLKLPSFDLKEESLSSPGSIPKGEARLTIHSRKYIVCLLLTKENS